MSRLLVTTGRKPKGRGGLIRRSRSDRMVRSGPVWAGGSDRNEVRPGREIDTMSVGVPREVKSDEYRVAMLPVGAEELTLSGHTVLVEAGAGLGSGLADAQYEAAGARIVAEPGPIWAEADLVVKVK